MDTVEEWQRNDVDLRIQNSKLDSKSAMQGTRSIISGVFRAVGHCMIGLNGTQKGMQVKVEQFWQDSELQRIGFEPVEPEQTRFVNSEVRAHDDVSDTLAMLGAGGAGPLGQGDIRESVAKRVSESLGGPKKGRVPRAGWGAANQDALLMQDDITVDISVDLTFPSNDGDAEEVAF